MLRWILMVKKLFTTPLTLVDYVRLFRAWRERALARRTRDTVKLVLEGLENRVVPSASTGNPPAMQQMASILSSAASTMNQEIQQIATVEQDLLAEARTIGQEFAQIISNVEQGWGRFLGLNLNASTPSLGTTKQQPSSGSGSGSGSNSGHSTPVDATPPAHSPTIGLTAKKAGSGIGTMSDPSSVGTATVNGQVWLDNNGDDNFDDGEMDFSGITVNLWSGGAVVATTTTNANTSGNNYQLVVNSVPPAGGQYEVEVLFLSGDDTTTEGSECQVAPDDFSDAFFLAPGGAANINAGANSLKVNTTADDAAGAIVQNQITLRDAIETANNPLRADPTINFSPGVNGEIQLIDDLPALDNDITINGPGMNVLAIVGSVFSIESGNTCAINNLTIEGGSGYLDGGGGVYNAGDLTLASDAITGNTAVSNGGGIYNATDSDLNLISSAVFNNTSLGYGGGIMNYGTLSICCNSQIYSNTAYNGGGLANFLLGKAEIYDNTVISNNKANDPNGGVGGGIYNSGDITMSAGGINNNTATYGGGVFVTGGTVTLTKGVFISNNKASSGGGIYIKSGNVKMSRGTISTNQAIVGTGKGGGIYVNGGSLTLTDGVLISHNKSLKNGGGIYINGGNATLSGGTLRFNSVQGAFNGGGIYNAAGTLTLNGGVYVGTENSAQQGGGMYLAADSRTNFNGVTVSGNVASNGGTGVYEQNGATVNPDPPKPPALNDPDDSGNLVKGP